MGVENDLPFDLDGPEKAFDPEAKPFHPKPFDPEAKPPGNPFLKQDGPKMFGGPECALPKDEDGDKKDDGSVPDTISKMWVIFDKGECQVE